MCCFMTVTRGYSVASAKIWNQFGIGLMLMRVCFSCDVKTKLLCNLKDLYNAETVTCHIIFASLTKSNDIIRKNTSGHPFGLTCTTSSSLSNLYQKFKNSGKEETRDARFPRSFCIENMCNGARL